MVGHPDFDYRLVFRRIRRSLRIYRTEYKKLLAYSSIENMGIIFIGLGIGFLAFSRDIHWVGALSLTAALLHCFNYTLFKGGLFLGVGSIYYATHTRIWKNWAA